MADEAKVGIQRALVGGAGDYSGLTLMAIPFKLRGASEAEVERLAARFGEEVAAVVDSIDGIEWCESDADCVACFNFALANAETGGGDQR